MEAKALPIQDRERDHFPLFTFAVFNFLTATVQSSGGSH